MKQFKRILICIDDLQRNAGMVEFIGRISRYAASSHIHLLHVGKPTDEGPDRAITVDAMRALCAREFKGHGGEEILPIVAAGSPLVEILRHGLQLDVDLIVVGRNPAASEHGDIDAKLARRVTRKATCSVLVVPKERIPDVHTIVTPVRNSDCSAAAASVAFGFSREAGAKVALLNVFQVHAGYSAVGDSLEAHQAKLCEKAKAEIDKLLKRFDSKDVEADRRCAPDLYDAPAPVILRQAEELGSELIVIGARGRTGAAGVLLGDVTEQLIRKSNVPVLAVKHKGECVGIVEALLCVAGQTT